MTKLHAVLAAEKTVLSAEQLLFAETESKLGKEQFFSGHLKTLSLIEDNTSKTQLEAAGRDVKALPTTVLETLNYYLVRWAGAEDLLFQKNLTNTIALADIEFGGQVLIKNVPVDEIMGLESRLTKLRTLFQRIPTLEASKKWEPRPTEREGMWQAVEPEITIKTENVIKPVVLYEATDKHPAQVKEISSNVTVGTFTKLVQSGAVTSRAKADSLAIIDNLIAEVKKARTRANEVNVKNEVLGQTIVDLIMAPIRSQGTSNS